MEELKDLISLLVTIDLGILAAAVTLLALYPAIAGFAARQGVAKIFQSERQRRSLFRWLGVTAFLSGVALASLTAQAIWGVLVENHAIHTGPLCLSDAAEPLGPIERWLAWFSASLSCAGLLAGAWAAAIMLRMTRNAS